MKLAFLCDGLEPGANGLGDMVRHHVPYLKARGVECLLLALNDRAIREVESEPASPAHFGAPILRIPHRVGYAACTRLVRERLARFQPDWVSLQFVSYGFAKKGIVLAEPFWMPRAIGGFPLHVMMHELWVGHGVFRTPRMALIGALQKRAIRFLLHRLRPRVVTTSCLYYADLLRHIGIDAHTIPLCGNVKVGDAVGGPWLEEALSTCGLDLARHGRRHYWIFGLFGSILRQWQPAALFARLASLARAHGLEAVVVCAGETGCDTAALLADWHRHHPEILFGALGRRSEAELSAFFNYIDFGLTSHPHYTAGKSGSIAAMLEHGLPTITSWGFEEAPEIAPIAGELGAKLWRCDAALEAKLLAPPKRVRIYDGAGRMARQLLDELAAASQHGT